MGRAVSAKEETAESEAIVVVRSFLLWRGRWGRMGEGLKKPRSTWDAFRVA